MTVSTQDLLCCYGNTTGQIQSLRLLDNTIYHLEKIVFPGQNILFEASSHSELEITAFSEGALHIERVPCQNLRVGQDDS